MAGLIIAADRSFAGKTTTTLALLAYWQSLGLVVAPGKVGPDFIDASYLNHLANYPCANLDLWMHGPSGVANIYQRMVGSAGMSPDICLIEACMGLFDGGDGSAARLAKALDLPLLLLLNVEGLAESARALASGYINLGLSIGLHFLGLVLTKVGSARHIEILKKALQPYLESLNLPLLGFLPKKDAPDLKSRHLGLVSVEESAHLFQDERLISWLTSNVHVGALNGLLGIDCQAGSLKKPLAYRPDLDQGQALDRSRWPKAFFGATKAVLKLPSTAPTLAIAWDGAFSFCYADLPALLAELGVRIVYFSPLSSKRLPECQGVYLPGGYPELYIERLANNFDLRDDLRKFASSGHLIYGECGGFIYLLESLTLTSGQTYPLTGLLPGRATLHKTRQALGYRYAKLVGHLVDFSCEISVRGHEFHYSDLSLTTSYPLPLWKIESQMDTDFSGSEGLVSGRVGGSYLHLSTEGGRDFWQALAKTLKN
ncbi:MAG: cobyrinate a,c-diamide synthase [Desulfovibrionaceae bacterium]|nr:cobyrinate a,c-diamide synthase [Desulfovibrionaceae bacterium]